MSKLSWSAHVVLGKEKKMLHNCAVRLKSLLHPTSILPLPQNIPLHEGTPTANFRLSEYNNSQQTVYNDMCQSQSTLLEMILLIG